MGGRWFGHSAPEYLPSDNGPEFIARKVQAWLAEKKIRTLYIDPGSPWQNGYVESFHGRFRDECLSRSCIPARKGAVKKTSFHKGWYRKRHKVENFFQRIKRPRRIATRYDKLAMVFMNFILLAATIDWIYSL